MTTMWVIVNEIVVVNVVVIDNKGVIVVSVL